MPLEKLIKSVNVPHQYNHIVTWVTYNIINIKYTYKKRTRKKEEKTKGVVEKPSLQLQQWQVATRWWAGQLSLEPLLYHTKKYGPNIGKVNNNQKQNPMMLRKKKKMEKETLKANGGGGSWFEPEEEQSCRFQHTHGLLASAPIWQIPASAACTTWADLLTPSPYPFFLIYFIFVFLI